MTTGAGPKAILRPAPFLVRGHCLCLVMTNQFVPLSDSSYICAAKKKRNDTGVTMNTLICGTLFTIVMALTACTHKPSYPAEIENDGKQTPMRNHPVFVAQHATACCCRGCIKKWHGFEAGVELSEKQQEYLVGLIMEWIRRQLS